MVPVFQVEKIGLFGILVHKYRFPLLALAERGGGGWWGGVQLSGAVCAVQSDWQRDTSASDILFEVEGGPQETSSFIVGSRKGRETSMTGFFFSLFVHDHCRSLCILRLIFVNKKNMYIKEMKQN